MNNEPFVITNPKMEAAVDELQRLILAHFPSTTFTVGEGMECDSVYMRAIVDVDDTDDVADVFMDRLVDFQVDEDLPISVVTIRTPEREAAALKRERADRRRPVMPI